jgi:hypothetical protein
MRIYSAALVLLAYKSPITKSMLLAMLPPVLLLLSTDLSITPPYSFAIVHICREFGGLEKKLREQRSRHQPRKVDLG